MSDILANNLAKTQTYDFPKNEGRKGYKKTKLGWIPEEWEILSLWECAKVDSKSLKRTTDHNYKFRYISLSDIEDGNINFESLTEFSFINAPSRARRIINRNDVLMSTVRPNLKAFAIIKSDSKDLIASTGFAVLTTNKKLQSTYLYNFLFSNKMESQLYNLVVGSNYPAINSSDVKNLKIILPSFIEQTAIATCLSTWDSAIATFTQLIEKKQQAKKGLMQQLLSGKKRLPGFVEEWKEYNLKSILKEVKRPIKWDDEELYDLISVRRRSNGLFHRDSLYGKQIKTKNLRTAKTGDFLFSKMQILHGASGLVTDEFDNMKISSSYIAVRAKNTEMLNMEFLNWYSQLPYFYHLCYISSFGVHIEKMTFDFSLFLKEKIKLPNIKEQTAIAQVLQTADDEIGLLNKKLDALKEQKKGLMQVLLTGRKRLEY